MVEGPLVQHGHGQKEQQRCRCQQHQVGKHVNQPDLPAGVFQPLLDEFFVSPLRRGTFRLGTSGKGATCHDDSPLPGLLVFLPLIIDGIGGR